jgi:hypothetical protein
MAEVSQESQRNQEKYAKIGLKALRRVNRTAGRTAHGNGTPPDHVRVPGVPVPGAPQRRESRRNRVWVPSSRYIWVQYLGPPGPSPSQILGTSSRFSEDFLGRERGGGP